ncbi:uncharacterized protein PRCAT00005303001 [Priceomyces carsonii]|uniref:uncharacterized protein n=1 Tax=Priceomyces carsonii TaxID=28549 RepID=UPI002EDBA623|nr:unnamed protein product [Priceomyces carsonii]
MPCMYFSGEESKEIAFDDPASECIRINPALFTKVQNDNEQNARVLLDTHLLRIRSYIPEDELSLEKIERIVPKSDASVSVETRASIPLLNFVTNLMTTADFKEMNSDEFKTSYLAPLDNALKGSDIKAPLLSQTYRYPFGATNVEGDIQEYFETEIARTLHYFFCDISGMDHYFGRPSIVRPPLDRRRIIKPDVIHLAMSDLSPNRRYPEVCFGIGEYKKKNYYPARGFEELKATLKEYNKSLSDQRNLRLHSTHTIFQDREWTPRVVCALVLRKYIYQAFLCGTDRVFISDHQSFSGFFRYNIANDGSMVINYYVINDPETVEHGITLRSAIAGFFYEERKEALDTKERLAKVLEVGTKTKGTDPFDNIVPRPVEEPSQGRKRSKLSGSELSRELKSIEENIDYDDFEEIYGNTYCRIVYDASKCYPGLGSILPTDVGKISLIDFGLSIFPCTEKCKSRDFEALDETFKVYLRNSQDCNQDYPGSQEGDTLSDKRVTKGNNGVSSFDGVVSEETSSQSTGFITEDFISEGAMINNGS